MFVAFVMTAIENQYTSSNLTKKRKKKKKRNLVSLEVEES